MTVSRATGTSISSPNTDTGAERCDRNATGSSQPSTEVPTALTIPNCGFSIVCHTNVTATTGATYGRSMDARTQVPPGPARSSASDAISPRLLAPLGATTENRRVVRSAVQQPGEV